MSLEPPERPEDTNSKNISFAAPLLAAAALLFSLTLLALAKTLNDTELVTFLIIALAALLPLFGAILAKWTRHAALADWFWASFVLSFLAAANQLDFNLAANSGPMILGISAAVSLSTAIFAKSRISLLLTSVILMAWSIKAYTSNPPAEFLWPYLLLVSLAIAWSWRQQNHIAAIGFAISIVIWTGFTAQAATVLRVGGSAQIALIAALFLGICCLLLLVTRKQRNQLDWDELILGVTGAGAAAFAFSPFASFFPEPAQSQTLLLWALLSSFLLIIGAFCIIKHPGNRSDKIGIALVMSLLIIAVFAPIGPVEPWWWNGIGGGILSIAGIWLSARGFAATDNKTGFAGLAIWATSVLLSSNGLEQQWLKIAILAIYSITAVGFYLLAERQFSNRKKPYNP